MATDTDLHEMAFTAVWQELEAGVLEELITNTIGLDSIKDVAHRVFMKGTAHGVECCASLIKNHPENDNDTSEKSS